MNEQDGFTTDTETPTAVVETPIETPAPVAETPQVQAEEAVPEESAQERDEKGRYKPSRKDWQSRVDRLTWEREEARREAAALRAQVEMAQAHQRPTPEPPKADQYTSRPKPTEDQIGTTYQSYAEFAEDLADWKFEVRFAQIREQEQQATAQREAQRVGQAYQSRVKEFAATKPDFHERVDAVSHLLVPEAMAEAIVGSERGPELSYYLASHPEEYAQLVAEWNAVPASAAPVVRRYLESRVAVASSGSTPAPRSFAPAPIKPVAGSAPVAASTRPEDLDFGPEYIRAMNEQERKLRRVR